MILYPDLLRDLIRENLQGRGMDATTLARRIGKGDDFVRDFLTGRKKSLPIKSIATIEEILGLQSGDLTQQDAYSDQTRRWLVETSSLPEHQKLKPERYPPRTDEDGAQPVPIFASQAGFNGLLSVDFKRPLERVPRPWFLRDISEGYCILISSPFMAPAYDTGDVVIVSPRLALTSQKDYVIRRNAEFESSQVMIRRLVTWDDDQWVVEGGAERSRHTLERVQWPICERIVGKACA